MTILLNPTSEEKLRAEAEAQGVSAGEYVKQLLETLFPPKIELDERTDREIGDSGAVLKPLIILHGSVPRLTKDEIY